MLRNWLNLKQLYGTVLALLGFMFVFKMTSKFQVISKHENLFASRIKSIEIQINELTLKTRTNSKLKLAQLQKTKATDIFTSWMTSFIIPNISDKRPSHHNKRILMTHPKCNLAYYLIILVQSNPLHASERMAIRKTWGRIQNVQHPMWKTFFLLTNSPGTQDLLLINFEMKTYGDIIYADINTENGKATLNSIMGFEWSSKHCTFRYLLKVNDDVFVNIHQLITFLNDNTTPDTELYAGQVHYASPVRREGEDSVSKIDYPKQRYPRYCSGTAYVLSSDIVRKMIKNVGEVKLFNIDDVFVGELALTLGVDPYQNDDFKINENPHKCEYSNISIVHSPVNIYCMETLQKNIV